MTSASAPYAPHHGQAHRPGFFARAEAWLDERGRGAWIAAAVVGFVFIWPIGLALLFYMIFAKGMFAGSCAGRKSHRAMKRTSGNSAFDAYRDDTLRRLEEEQDNFEAFLDRLRAAKDKAEFDQFMDERVRETDEPKKSDDA